MLLAPSRDRIAWQQDVNWLTGVVTSLLRKMPCSRDACPSNVDNETRDRRKESRGRRGKGVDRRGGGYMQLFRKSASAFNAPNMDQSTMAHSAYRQMQKREEGPAQ